MSRKPLRRVGLELEFPVVDTATGRGMDRATVKDLWRSFACQDGSWAITQEAITGAVTGVHRKNAGFTETVNTDTGVCTIEISLAPQETIDLAVHRANVVVRDLQRLLAQRGHTLLCAGIQPRTWFDPNRKTQKDWYILLSRRWSFHHWFVPIASHQVSIDVAPDEAVRVINLLCGFAGIFAGLTASSPIARGTVQPWKEMRNWIWFERCKRISVQEALYTSNGIPQAPFADIGSYVEYCWSSRIFFITDLKSNGYEIIGRKSFKDFILCRHAVSARKVDGDVVGIIPSREMLDRIHQYGWLAAKLHYVFDTCTDIESLRMAIMQGRTGEYFREHAVNCYIENRSCGVAPEGEEGVGAALTLGLIEELDYAELILKELEWDEWRRLWVSVSKDGLSSTDSKALGLMREVLELAKRGLRARGAGEEAFLEPLFVRLERCEIPADAMISAFSNGGLRRLITDFARSA